jgi:chemotaxis-related protein WspB
MVLIVFRLGADEYALDTANVAAVLPLVELKAIPHAAPGVAGIFNYRGTTVPVIDLSLVMAGVRARAYLDTRIIVIRHQPACGDARLLGLLVENATRTLRKSQADFSDPGIAGAAWLGPVTLEAGRLIQRIEPDRLLMSELGGVLRAGALAS